MKNIISQGLIYLGGFCGVGGLIVITFQIALALNQGNGVIQQEFTSVSLPPLVVLIGFCVMIAGAIVLVVGLRLRPDKMMS